MHCLVPLCVTVTSFELTITHIKRSCTLQLEQTHCQYTMPSFLYLFQGTSQIIHHRQDIMGRVIGTHGYAWVRPLVIEGMAEVQE